MTFKNWLLPSTDNSQVTCELPPANGFVEHKNYTEYYYYKDGKKIGSITFINGAYCFRLLPIYGIYSDLKIYSPISEMEIREILTFIEQLNSEITCEGFK